MTETLTATLTPEQETRFQELSKASYKKVFSLAYRLSGDRADAEDLTQEAFFRAYRGFDGFEGDRPFENWIFRILTRLYLDMKRARSRRVQTVSSDAPIRAEGREDTVQFDVADDRPRADEILMRGVVSPELEQSLLKLSEDQRRLVWLADVEGMPYNEIATMMDAPVGTIRSRLHRAHKQLRAVLSQMKQQPGELCLGC